MRELGIVTGHLPVLTALWNDERLSQSELAKRARVEQSSMAENLMRMQRDGLIQREPDPTDRRSSLVSLTEVGRSKIPAIGEIVRVANEQATEGMTQDEIDTLIGLVTRLLSNLEKMEAGSS